VRIFQRWRQQTSFKARIDDICDIARATCRPEEIRIKYSGCRNTNDSARFAMKKWITAAVVFSFCLFGSSAFAQTGSTAPKKGQAPPTAQSDKDSEGAEEPQQQEEETPKLAPVLWVMSVEAMSSTHAPTLDVIRVRGITSTDGWEEAELVPLTKGTPPDGMLDLAFVAQAPTNSTSPSKSPVIEAVFTLEPGHPFKGVRVHSATNRVTLKGIPGYAEAPPPPGDCTDCVGKYFVAKGETAPANVNSGDVIHEENLPKILHVVKPTEGIGKLDSDPNRLTIVIGDDGRIVIAVWD
jgi:hypothetical protein